MKGGCGWQLRTGEKRREEKCMILEFEAKNFGWFGPTGPAEWLCVCPQLCSPRWVCVCCVWGPEPLRPLSEFNPELAAQRAASSRMKVSIRHRFQASSRSIMLGQMWRLWSSRCSRGVGTDRRLGSVMSKNTPGRKRWQQLASSSSLANNGIISKDNKGSN